MDTGWTQVEGVPDAEVLDGHLMTQFQPEHIRAMLEGMTAANVRIDIAAHFFTPDCVIESEAGSDGAPVEGMASPPRVLCLTHNNSYRLLLSCPTYVNTVCDRWKWKCVAGTRGR